MIYQNFKLDSKNWDFLRTLKRKNRIPNALLFYGNEGMGKEAYAIEFASFLNCTDPSNSAACRKCSSCKKIMHNNHEYLHYILPLPKGKIISKKDDILKAFNEKTLLSYDNQIKLKLENPYHKIHIDGANTILINSIRSIKKKLSRTISDNVWQIILIFNAEKLCFPNQEAANSLLKILEEPPLNTVFILVTSKNNLLLDTIKSRCIELHFSKASKKISENKSNQINMYNLVNGNMKIKNELDDEDVAKIKIFLDLYNNYIKNPDNSIIIKLISTLEKLSKSNKSLFSIYIDVLKNYYRDLSITKINSESKELTFLFLKDDYSIINQKKMSLSWESCIDNICKFEKDIEFNLNSTLSLFNLFNNIGIR